MASKEIIARKKKDLKITKDKKKGKKGAFTETQEDEENIKNLSEMEKEKNSRNMKQSSGVSRPLSRPASSESRKSPLPFKHNIVEPMKTENSGEFGSSASVKSSHSKREAWSDRTNFVTSGSQNSNNHDTMSIVSRVSDRPEQHAYVPYLYARSAIAKVVDDMKFMKERHVKIVHNIEDQYKFIEDETQDQYSEKVKIFKQVIDTYRNDLQQKEEYWKDSLQSLTEKNNQLLKEKQLLIVKTTELTEQLDELNTANTMTVKSNVVNLQEEIKVLQNHLENEKSEVIRLKGVLADKETLLTSTPGGSVASSKTKGDKSSPRTSVQQSSVRTNVVSGLVAVNDKSALENERDEMDREKKQIADERMKHAEEKKKWFDELNELRVSILETQKESAEWKAKYEVMHDKAQSASSYEENYLKLEALYNNLALVVAASEESKNVAEDHLVKKGEEKLMMKQEKDRLENEIKKWEAKFQKKHKRKPTDDDKNDSEKEMYIQLEEVNTIMTSIEGQIDSLESVKKGEIPKPVLPPPKQIEEPQIKTIEIKVPDPDIMVKLESYHDENTDLQSKLNSLQQEKSDLKAEIRQLNADLLNGGQGSILTTAQGNVASEELKRQLDEKQQKLGESQEAEEKLQKEKREMQKDMKKMLKQYGKLQEKSKEAGADDRLLLQMIVNIIHEIHKSVNEARAQVDKRLKDAQNVENQMKESVDHSQKLVDSWQEKYRKKHKGKEPAVTDRDGEAEKIYQNLEGNINVLAEKQRELKALNILKSGEIPFSSQQVPKESLIKDAEVEEKLSALDDKVIDLESENSGLKEQNDKLRDSIEELENEVVQLNDKLLIQENIPVATEDSEGLAEDVTKLQGEINLLNSQLFDEKMGHDNAKEEVESLQKIISEMKEEREAEKMALQAELNTTEKSLEAEILAKIQEIEMLEQRNKQLEDERLANVPVDTAKEIKNLQAKNVALEKGTKSSAAVETSLKAEIAELQTKLDTANRSLEKQRAVNRDIETKVKMLKSEKDVAVREITSQMEKNEKQRMDENKKKIQSYEKKIRELETRGPQIQTSQGKAVVLEKGSKEELMSLKRENNQLNMRIKQLESSVNKPGRQDTGEVAAADKLTMKRHEKILKELEKKYEMEKAKCERNAEMLKQKDEELKQLQKTGGQQDSEVKKLKAELNTLTLAAKEGVEAGMKVKSLESENKTLIAENKVLTENYNSERVLRKKYYNIIEDMKGKIRVYCRSRPLSSTEKDRGNHAVVKSPDEYTIQLESQRGMKEFQFDQIFMEDSTQEKIFEDTNNLIQSAVDGYNVCIFAYGQTGSGKTFTMIGDREQRFPGIAPRAFNRIFELADEVKSKFTISVQCYMLELYNEKLIDLFAKPGTSDDDKLDIKKDKKGMVFVSGAVVQDASNSKELMALFEAGSKNRHTASTKMNAESSRSHLIIGIVMESTNKTNGQVIKGKLSLVDLAGSERVGKTGASAEQLKEAMSINKSLSALGDVISALSSEQSFIPYRNNKLTMLMQDSLGGNAKTLMFVNISPADYNTDESVISLTYASRVKLITNDASKNADNKEINRLKNIIGKLQRGEALTSDDVV